MASNAKNAENDAAPSTPKAGSGGGYGSLTAREQEILAKAMTCLKTAPEIDFPQLADELNMTNPRSAVNAWAQIKKKMGWNIKVADAPASAKATGAGKRKKAAANDDDAGDADEIAAPAKKARTTAKPRKKLPDNPKKGKAAAVPKSPVSNKDDSEEAEAEVKADSSDDVKEDLQDGEA
ncbi:hypothetical protein Daus18300_008353 [Diaporthe australafricana]|uniref:Uncharacterized protein n=1 Tax=Diaporthe australafricana TaxID=127596 RepID=A0ABR3WIP9_9PEZI